jgi:hypothetical protein
LLKEVKEEMTKDLRISNFMDWKTFYCSDQMVILSKVICRYHLYQNSDDSFRKRKSNSKVHMESEEIPNSQTYLV